MWSNFSIREVLLLGAILLLGLGLRIQLSQDRFLHPWDERYHALVAKNTMKAPLAPTLYTETPLGYDHKAWNANHIWLHKQPVPIWLMAGALHFFGTSEFSVRLPSIILSTVAIFLTFLLGSLLFNRKTGLLAAFFHAINGLLIELCAGRIATDHYDTLFLVFIEASILFMLLRTLKKKWIYLFLAGLFCGLAILTKWLPALIVFPVGFLLGYRKGRLKQQFQELFYIFGVVLLVALPWQIYIYTRFPAEADWEGRYNFLHFFTVLDNQGGNIFYYLNKIRTNYSEIIYLPIAWFIYLLIKKRKDPAIPALLAWVLIPLVFFSLCATKMQAYISFTAPALFIMSAQFVVYLFSETNKGNKTEKALSIVLIVLSLGLPIRYCIERLKISGEEYDRQPAWSMALRELKTRQMAEGKKLLIYNVKHPIEMMFYVDCIAYPNDSLKKEEVLKALGKNYIIVKNPTTNL